MPVNAADLVAPSGELEGNLFPGEDPAATGGRLDQYIDEANSLIADMDSQPDNPDSAVKAWAYHRAYRAVFIRMSADPTRANLDDQGTEQFDVKQADRFRTLSEEKLDLWNRLTISDETASPEAAGGTGAVSNEFFW